MENVITSQDLINGIVLYCILSFIISFFSCFCDANKDIRSHIFIMIYCVFVIVISLSFELKNHLLCFMMLLALNIKK